MRYLLAEEILAIHDRILFQIGGREGIRDMGLLYSIAERPKTGMLGRDFYSTLFMKGAASLEALATYHVFVDGNKRTAITVASLFLKLNGYELELSEKETLDFMLAVATKKKSVKEIARWLKDRSKKVVS
ncbi:type II toxin-antitoxin system death-on-curing family toxin [Patescibacteria group bacterium]|nr:type II toxin-antitoxin system death-on-curing family toxin [Patescibacteria group bacterium]